MITSDQIQGRVGGFPGGRGQMMPTIYGTRATSSFSHGDQDPYGYGMASGFAGTMVGAAGISTLGGVVGTSALFGGMIRGGQRAWDGLKRAGAGARTLWGAGQYGLAAQTAGMGALRAGMTALPHFALAYGTYKTLTGIGNAMYSGARFQQDANRVIGRALRFQTGSSSRTGFGASHRQMQGITRMIDSMTDRDTLRTRSELMRVMDKLGRRDFFQDTTSVNQFRKKFKDMVKTLKHMAQTFGTTLEEAIPLLDTMRRSGIYGTQAQKATALRIRTAGLDPGQAMGLMTNVAQMGRASGGHGGAAAAGALSMMRQLSFMQNNMGKKIGTRVSNLMTEITGGKTGQAAAADTAQRMSALTLRFLRSPLGRMALAGMANQKMTGMDAGVMEQLKSGELTLGNLRRMGFANTASMGAKARFINREGDLRTAFLKQGGATAMAGLVQSAMRSHIIRGTSNRDIQEIIMKRFTGGNRRMAQLLFTMMKNLPQMRRDMFRGDLRQTDLRYRAAMGRDHYSFTAMGRRFRHGMHSVFVRPFQNLGADMYQGLKRWGMNMMDNFSGTTSVNLSRGGADATISALSGDRSDAAQSNIQRYLGGAGQYNINNLDFQRKRGWLGRKSTIHDDGAVGMIAKGAARWITGHRGYTQDLGDKMLGMFGEATLRAYGASVDTMKNRGNRAVLYRVNKSGQLQQRGQDSANTQAMMMSANQARRLLNMDKRRASGARGLEVIKTNVKHQSTIKAAAQRIRQKILGSPEIMARLRNANPSERRQIMREEFKKAAQNLRGMDGLVSSIANKKYGDVGGSSSAVGRQQAWDDVIAGAELVNEKLGIQSQSSYATGDPADKFENAKAAKEATNTAIDKLGHLSRHKSWTNLGRFLTFRGSSTQRNWVNQSDIFRSRTDLSDAVMKHAARMDSELSSKQKRIIQQIQSHRGGSMVIDGKTYDEATVKQLQNTINMARTRGARAFSGHGYGSRFSRQDYEKWVGGLRKQNLIAAQAQVQRFGVHMGRQLKGVSGPLGRRLQTLFTDLQTIKADSGAFKQLGDRNEFGKIARDFSRMRKGERTKFLRELSRKGRGGAMIASALRTYMKGDKLSEAERMKRASKQFYGLAVGKGSVTVGKYQASMKDALAVWSDYVRVNQQFVQAVGAVMGQELKTKAAALAKAARKGKQGNT